MEVPTREQLDREWESLGDRLLGEYLDPKVRTLFMLMDARQSVLKILTIEPDLLAEIVYIARLAYHEAWARKLDTPITLAQSEES